MGRGPAAGPLPASGLIEGGWARGGADLRKSEQRPATEPQSPAQHAMLLSLAVQMSGATRSTREWLQAEYPGPGQRG